MLRPWQLLAWGNGSSGQLAIGSTPEECTLPTLVQGLSSPPYAMAAGGSHTLFLTEDRKLFVWGSGADGQLGAGRAANSVIPHHFALPTQAVLSAVAAVAHNLVENGRVYAWGSNSHGQVGLGPATTQPALPSLISLAKPATRVACGMRHSLCVLDDGTLYAWGESKQAEPCTPMLVPSVASIPIRSLSAGARHSAYVLSDGRVFAFGNNRFGQLGVDPATTAASADPIHIAALDGLGVKQIQCGWHHCVVLTESGDVWAFGKNAFGQLGYSGTQNSFAPKRIPLDGKTSAIACGSEHTLVLLESGVLLSCGWNEHGQLGIGDVKDRSVLSRVVSKETSICSFVASGYGHAFGLFT